MKPYAKVTFNVETLQKMTKDQWFALIENVLAPGKWEDQAYDITCLLSDRTVMIGGLPIVIGIEHDGYTHS